MKGFTLGQINCIKKIDCECYRDIIKCLVVVMRNSANVGFSQLFGRYKQTITIHNRMTNVSDIFTINIEVLTLNVCTPGLAGKTQNISVRSNSYFIIYNPLLVVFML